MRIRYKILWLDLCTQGVSYRTMIGRVNEKTPYYTTVSIAVLWRDYALHECGYNNGSQHCIQL